MSVEIPRNFRLLDELEQGEKSFDTDGSISYGLDKADDSSLTDWVGTVLGQPGTNFNERIISVSIHCDQNYPKAPPTVKFISKVNLPFVDDKGNIILNKFPLLRNWNSETTIFLILKEISNLMKKNGRLPQPPDGQTY